MFARAVAKFPRRCVTSFFLRAQSTCAHSRQSQEEKGNAAAFMTKRQRPLNSSSVVCMQNRAYSSDGDDIAKKIEKLVNNNKVVVFMKGVPEQPMCGFSNAVVQVLRIHGVDNYDSHNVLEDEELRQGIKDFSSWPTIPQVYFNGEFIGGCDILLQMHQNGELIEELEKVGVKSAVQK